MTDTIDLTAQFVRDYEDLVRQKGNPGLSSAERARSEELQADLKTATDECEKLRVWNEALGTELKTTTADRDGLRRLIEKLFDKAAVDILIAKAVETCRRDVEERFKANLALLRSERAELLKALAEKQATPKGPANAELQSQLEETAATLAGIVAENQRLRKQLFDCQNRR